LIEQGISVSNIAILAVNATQQTRMAFTGASGVTADVTDFQDIPGQGQLFTVTITAASDTALGDRGLQLTNADGTAGPAAPGKLSIVAPGTLGQQAARIEPRAMTATAGSTVPCFVVEPAAWLRTLMAKKMARPRRG